MQAHPPRINYSQCDWINNLSFTFTTAALLQVRILVPLVLLLVAGSVELAASMALTMDATVDEGAALAKFTETIPPKRM
jgi:hypothetical protein